MRVHAFALCLFAALAAAGNPAAFAQGAAVPAPPPVVSASPSWWQAVRVSASAAGARVENISRTSDSATRRDATTYEAVLAAAHHRQLNRVWSLTTAADLTVFREPDFDRNEFTAVAGRLTVQRKAGLGPLAPVIQWETALLRHQADYVSNRGTTLESAVRFNRRLSSSLRASVSAQWREHFARASTFDTHQRGAALSGTWDFADRWSLLASVLHARGRFLTHAGPASWSRALGGAQGPEVARIYASIPREVTGLYGPNWITYRPSARVTTGSASLLFAFSDQVSAEAQFSVTSLTDEADVHYPTRSLTLRLACRF